MSTRDLTQLADHAGTMLTHPDTPPLERDLWRSISREIRAYLDRDNEQPPTQDEALFATQEESK